MGPHVLSSKKDRVLRPVADLAGADVLGQAEADRPEIVRERIVEEKVV